MNRFCKYRNRVVSVVLDGLSRREAQALGFTPKSHSSVLIRVRDSFRIVDSNELIDVSEEYSAGYLFGKSRASSGDDVDSLIEDLAFRDPDFIEGVRAAFSDYERTIV